MVQHGTHDAVASGCAGGERPRALSLPFSVISPLNCQPTYSQASTHRNLSRCHRVERASPSKREALRTLTVYTPRGTVYHTVPARYHSNSLSTAIASARRHRFFFFKWYELVPLSQDRPPEAPCNSISLQL